VWPVSDVSVDSEIISDNFVCEDNTSRKQVGRLLPIKSSPATGDSLEGGLLIEELPHGSICRVSLETRATFTSIFVHLHENPDEFV
jgi:hypothetical protein